MQEEIQPLTTENSVVNLKEGNKTLSGTLVRAKDPVIVIGTKEAKYLGDGVEHEVHRAIAAKYVGAGFATFKNTVDKEIYESAKPKVEKPAKEKA